MNGPSCLWPQTRSGSRPAFISFWDGRGDPSPHQVVGRPQQGLPNGSNLHSYFPQRLSSRPSGEGLWASPRTSPFTGTERALGPASIPASSPTKLCLFNFTSTLRARKLCQSSSPTGHWGSTRGPFLLSPKPVPHCLT